MKAEVTALYRSSDGPEAFRAALDDAGYVLANGDKRDFVIVDRAGGTHSLPKRIAGMKTAELRNYMAPIDRASLPTVDQAKEIQLDRGVVLDEIKWEEALEANAIAAALKAEKEASKAPNAKVEDAHDHDSVRHEIDWEEALATAAIAAAKKAAAEELKRALALEEWKEKSRADALVEVGYSRSDDMVHQN